MKSSRAASACNRPTRATPRLFSRNARSAGASLVAEQFGKIALRALEVATLERLERRGVGLRNAPGSETAGKPEHSFPDVHDRRGHALSGSLRAVRGPLDRRAGRRGGPRARRYHHLLDELGAGERADGPPFGGGAGMVLRLEPIARVRSTGCLRSRPRPERTRDRRAQPERQAARASPTRSGSRRSTGSSSSAATTRASTTASPPCIRSRSTRSGDFVLTGGEIPALAILDATVRLIAGALRQESLTAESFSGDGGLLDHPSYTRPPVFRGVRVPEVLLSGDHAKIAEWRRQESRRRTVARRPDLVGEDGS